MYSNANTEAAEALCALAQGKRVLVPRQTRRAQRFSNCYTPEALPLSGFLLNGVPGERSLLLGVEEKATLPPLSKSLYVEPLAKFHRESSEVPG
jgi:hypothetical protein